MDHEDAIKRGSLAPGAGSYVPPPCTRSLMPSNKKTSPEGKGLVEWHLLGTLGPFRDPGGVHMPVPKTRFCILQVSVGVECLGFLE